MRSKTKTFSKSQQAPDLASNTTVLQTRAFGNEAQTAELGNFLQARPFGIDNQATPQQENLESFSQEKPIKRGIVPSLRDREACLWQRAANVSNTPPSASNSISPLLQAKLSIGQPGDKYEQEADQVASQVVSQINTSEASSNATVQREGLIKDKDKDKIAPKSLTNSIQREETIKEEDKDKIAPKSMLQRQPSGGMTAAPDIESSIQQAKGSGQALSNNIRQPMEQAFGADFSTVKIHTDSKSDNLNQSIQARAFTTGSDIFFRQGEYNPGSTGGQELLAHELTHVVQQGGSNPIQQKEEPSIQPKLQPNSENVANIQKAPVQVAQQSSNVFIARDSIMQNIPGGAKNLENVSGDTESVVQLLERVAVQAGGSFGSNADFRTNVAPQIDGAFASNLSNTNIPIDFIETRGANVHWKGYVKFKIGTPVPVQPATQTTVTSSYGGSATQSNQVTNATTDGAKVTGGLKSGDAKEGGEASVGGELSTSTTRTTQGTTSTTATRGGTTSGQAMIVTYEAPLIAEVYLAPEMDVSGSDYVNPFKWGMYLGEAVAPLSRKSGTVVCGKIRYGLSQ